ncbi:MAG: hypothetical protein ACRDTZ_01285 [Pseudonocardiaceae bacterium]
MVVIFVALVIITALVAGINGWREKHAKRNACWEPYAAVVDGGKVEFGIRLVARWGNREEELQRDQHTERTANDDYVARYEALSRAEAHAESINSLQQTIRGRK